MRILAAKRWPAGLGGAPGPRSGPGRQGGPRLRVALPTCPCGPAAPLPASIGRCATSRLDDSSRSRWVGDWEAQQRRLMGCPSLPPLLGWREL